MLGALIACLWRTFKNNSKKIIISESLKCKPTTADGEATSSRWGILLQVYEVSHLQELINSSPINLYDLLLPKFHFGATMRKQLEK